MLRTADLDRSEAAMQRPVALPQQPAVPPSHVSGGGYRPGASTPRGRIVGISLAVAVHVVVGALLVVRWHDEYVKKEQAALSVFDVAPPAPPVETTSKDLPTPELVPPPTRRRPVEQPPIEVPLIQLPTPAALPVPQVRPAPPAPPVERTEPEAKPVPAPPPPGTGKPTWEGQVLAALNKVRRYPREAMFRKQQGVPYIRFVIDREGRVLNSRLERSSSVASLDAEAVALPKRAQPLPRPPESVEGETIELVLPVEFFVR
ncbi:TonB family protein [Novosphingobium sp. BL-52-GroH]|uniref:TonB family protein n=1 Tax=Novosphingobium sp. BL-52-GroH TaxID=3349877 RepID=UPI00384D8034